MSEESITQRYAFTQAVDYEVKPKVGLHGCPVTRAFLATSIGGSPHATYSKISARKRDENGHSFDALFCPDQLWNPYIPTTYGARGLYFTLRSKHWRSPIPLIVKLGTNQWVYQGHYLAKSSLPLSPEEWTSLNSAVRAVLFVLGVRGICS